MTVTNLERELEKLSPDETWLAQIEKAEQEGKKREGILKAIQACRAAKRIGETSAAARTAAEEARIKKMSVTPEMCRIAALGYALGDGEPVSMVVGLNDVTEEGILEMFWGLLRSHSPLVGFNILGFDLPVIFVRSAILGVLPTKLIDMKAWGQDTIDLMQARFPKSGATRLKELARMYGFEIPAGDTDGGAVYQLMQTEPVKVAEYVKSDIVVTRQLHHFYRGFFCR